MAGIGDWLTGLFKGMEKKENSIEVFDEPEKFTEGGDKIQDFWSGSVKSKAVHSDVEKVTNNKMDEYLKLYTSISEQRGG